MRFDIRPAVVPSVVGLVAQGGIRANQLSWESFGYSVAIYANTVNNRNTAARVGTGTGSTFTHVLPGPSIWYYWVRGIDAQGRETGVWNPTGANSGVTVTSKLMEELDIAAGAVTAAKLAVAAISPVDGKLVADAVDALNIKLGAVTAAKLAIAAIDSSSGELNANSVTTRNIVAGSISTNQISSAYVYAGNISAYNITAGTLNAGVTYTGSLSANNITSGTLASNVVYAGSISANNISSGTLSSQVVYAGTISANNISGGTISGITFRGGGIYIGSGGTPSGNQFEVQPGGLAWMDSLVCRNGIFESNSSVPPVSAYQYDAGTVSATFSTVSSGNYSGNAHGVVGKNARAGTSGICGVANGYDFYADGSGINYGPFTGAHDTLIKKGEVPNIGDILVDTGIAVKKNLSNTISYSTKSTMPLQKGSCGVMAKAPEAFGTIMLPTALREDDFVSIGPDGKEVTTQTYCREYDQIRRTHNLAAMNAVGEGQVNVCGEGGDLVIGDLIVTSSMAGKGMRQTDDLIRSYTIAKVRENVTFESPEEVRMVACIYLCG
jgi:hypothetical protein